MNKLTLDEIKCDVKLYTLLIDVCQILKDVRNIYALCDKFGNIKVVYLTTNCDSTELDFINCYLHGQSSSVDSVPVLVGVKDVNFASSNNYKDLSVIVEELEGCDVSTVKDDLCNLYVLTNDINIRLCILNELVSLLVTRAYVPEEGLLFDRATLGELSNFAHIYMHYGKRAAYSYFKNLFQNKDSINKIASYFKLDPILN